MNYQVTPTLLKEFASHLCLEEKSEATIEKYTRDLRTFAEYIKEGGLS